MARSISARSLQKLSQSHGVEPIMVLEVQWGITGTYTRYSSKGFGSSPGKLQSVGAVDSTVAISLNETSEEFSVVLDDTDGSIKSIIDVNDVMLRNVRLYQWFEGIPFSDRFLIFQGKINSPISWTESDRTIKFNVVSQLEDKDVGFAPEEGRFPDLPDDMIGKIWPECFGTSIHQEAIQVDFKHQGQLGEPIGLPDFTIPSRQAAIQVVVNYLNSLGVLYSIAAGFAGFLGQESAQQSLEQKANGFFQQAGQKTQEITDLGITYAAQSEHDKDSFRVIGGENFPRGTLKLLINGAIYTGSFSGDTFNASCKDHPERKNFHVNQTPCGNPADCAADNTCKQFPSAEGFTITQVNNASSFIPTGNILGDQAGPFFADGGASVTIYSDEPIRYFTSITPGQVLKVAAFATFDGNERVLVDVPESLYRVYNQNYGSVTVKVVEMNDALSKQDPPWEDRIYVTYKSNVGPNPIDILKYLINKYADIPFDSQSFSRCRNRLRNYPMHFCLSRKKNIVTVIKELAFQARLAISIKNGKFFCRYMPERPTSVHTFSEDNVLERSVELGYSDTEDLVTKYVGKWRAHGAQDEDNQIVSAYNVKKYGIHEEEVDFYAYNYPGAIIKALGFWISRRGNVWKKLKFKTALDALNVETLDGVTLNFQSNYASNGATLGCIESSEYDPDSNTLSFTAWTGVRSGEMVEYDLSYPSDVSTTQKFPTQPEIAAGFAGRDGPSKSSSGNILRVGRKQGVNVTFQNNDPYQDGSRAKQDQGPNKPSDNGDSSPGNPNTTTTGQASKGTPPPDTSSIRSGTIDNPGETFWIDIRTTEISDSNNPGNKTTLATFFDSVTDGKLKGSTGATWTDGAEDGEFDFKFDDEGGKFGAGTAFLKDD